MFLMTCFAGTAKGVMNYVNPDPQYLNDEDFDDVTIEFSHMWIDELWVTSEIQVGHDEQGQETDIVNWESFPEWDAYTWMRADYRKNPKAGNNNYNIKDVMAVKIKRRFPQKPYSPWQTIIEKKIATRKDFNFNVLDYLEPNKTLVEYVYVPVAYNGSEYPFEETKTATVVSWFRNYFIIDQDKPYPAIIDAVTTPNMNVPTDVVEAFGSKYPFVIRKGITKYRSGTMTASYIGLNCCDDRSRTHWEYEPSTGEYYEAEPDYIVDMDNAWKYRNEVEEFISNGHAKLIKSPEGDLWLVSMSAAPSRSRNGDYRYVTTSFDWVEVGHPLNGGDLYNAGLIDTDVDAGVTL